MERNRNIVCLYVRAKKKVRPEFLVLLSENKLNFILLPHSTVLLKQQWAEFFFLQNSKQAETSQKHDTAAAVLSEINGNK